MREEEQLAQRLLLDNHPRFSYVKSLGGGATGIVHWVADFHRHPPQDVAVKLIKRGPETITHYVRAEILNQRELYHPHVIQFSEVLLLEDYLCIVLELSPKGSLADFVNDHGCLNEVWTRHYFQQLILGVDYCHQQGISNRDIKLQNMCLSGDNCEILKLCDFGLSKSEKWQSKPKSMVGTISYVSPEICLADPDRRYDGKLVDVWSCGVALCIMMTMRSPFEPPTMSPQQDDANHLAILQRILRGAYTAPSGISNDLKDLLSKIFVPDPDQRITVEGIKAHPWFLQDLPRHALEMTYKWTQERPPSRQSEVDIDDILSKAAAKKDTE